MSIDNYLRVPGEGRYVVGDVKAAGYWRKDWRWCDKCRGYVVQMVWQPTPWVVAA